MGKVIEKGLATGRAVVHGCFGDWTSPAFWAYAKSEEIDTKTEEKEAAKVTIQRQEVGIAGSNIKKKEKTRPTSS
jgi:hypothetical protein